MIIFFKGNAHDSEMKHMCWAGSELFTLSYTHTCCLPVLKPLFSVYILWFFFWGRVLPCSPSWPGNYYGAHTGLELGIFLPWDSATSASSGLEFLGIDHYTWLPVWHAKRLWELFLCVGNISYFGFIIIFKLCCYLLIRVTLGIRIQEVLQK
jgi:hypothetical protein